MVSVAYDFNDTRWDFVIWSPCRGTDPEGTWTKTFSCRFTLEMFVTTTCRWKGVLRSVVWGVPWGVPGSMV